MNRPLNGTMPIGRSSRVRSGHGQRLRIEARVGALGEEGHEGPARGATRPPCLPPSRSRPAREATNERSDSQLSRASRRVTRAVERHEAHVEIGHAGPAAPGRSGSASRSRPAAGGRRRSGDRPAPGRAPLFPEHKAAKSNGTHRRPARSHGGSPMAATMLSASSAMPRRSRCWWAGSGRRAAQPRRSPAPARPAAAGSLSALVSTASTGRSLSASSSWNSRSSFDGGCRMSSSQTTPVSVARSSR